MDQQVTTVYQSDKIKIATYHCGGGHGGRSREEWAEQDEIVFPRAGTFVRYDAGGRVVADANQVLFFRCGQPYEISHPISGGDRSTIFNVAPGFLEKGLGTDVVSDQNHFVIGHLPVRMRQRLMHHQLLYMLACADVEAFEIEELVWSLLGDVICSSRNYPQQGKQGRAQTCKEYADLSDHVKVFLGAHFQEKVALEEIASAVFCSPYHLCRVFKQVNGVTIYTYLKRLRLIGVLEHLAEFPKTGFAAIALDFGFASHSHFSTVFRKEFGVQPSEMRPPKTSWFANRAIS